MVIQNRLLEKLGRGEPAIGCQVRSRSAQIAEIFGYSGFDYIFIENEHFIYNSESVEEIIRACDISGTEPILRLPDHDPGKILQFLDAGVSGLMLPHVDTPEQARAIVEAGKYRPQGKRGFTNASRATRYGGLPIKDYQRLSNANTMLIGYIESETAVRNLEGILAAGLDAIHIGPGDLAETIPDPDELKRALDYIVATARKARIPVASVAANIKEALKLVECGVSMVSYSSDLMLLKGMAGQVVSTFREKVAVAP
jgi:2-keto-3-deoxy-L-rhamnonate aldolase RhmA